MRGARARFSTLARIAVSSALLATAGCAVVDQVGFRSETINRAMAEYNNDAILLNIVRASRYEPLNFVGVTQTSPNMSISSGLPVFNMSPKELTSWTWGNNSLSGSVSDVLTIQPIDDPASWQAMLTPLDAATIGFFIKQGYPRELLLRLFIDRVIFDGVEYVNQPDPNDPDPLNSTFGLFNQKLAQLVLVGFTVEVERGSPKSGQNPTSRICLSKTDADRTRKIVEGFPGSGSHPIRKLFATSCSEWLAGQAADSTTSKPGGAKAAAGPGIAARGPRPLGPSAWYDIPPWTDNYAPFHHTAKFSTRSAYATYQYLGRLLEALDKTAANQVPLVTLPKPDNQVLAIESGGLGGGCFTEINYHLRHYCVPNEANTMKQIFGLLHQVAGLNIAHAQTPGPLTVRNVP